MKTETLTLLLVGLAVLGAGYVLVSNANPPPPPYVPPAPTKGDAVDNIVQGVADGVGAFVRLFV